MRQKSAYVLVCTVLLGACAGSGGNGGNGSGGNGSGGTTGGTGGSASGGSPSASGGSSASGGAPGTGGAPSSGGRQATGGATSAGGTSGSGGGGGGPTDIGGRGGAITTGGTGAAAPGGRAGGGGGAATGGAAGAAGPHWVGTWASAPQLTEMANLPPASLSGSVLRQVTHVSLGGSQIRVRFSNEFGNGMLTINGAHVALCKNNPVDSTIDVATDKALTFAGLPGVTIAQGKAAWSDPLDFAVAAMSNLTVTVAFGSVPSDVTGHPASRTTSYQQTGSTDVSAASMASAQKPVHWYVLSGIDVMADGAAHGLVILGDSITDGRGSTTDANNRWPDLLAKRLQANAPTNKVAVMNVAIGGNAVTAMAQGGLGPPASSRYMRDVLSQSGVRWIIIFEGVNDVGTDVLAAPVTAAFDQMISQAHALGLLVYGATVTPFAGHSYYSVAHEVARQDLNTYIRSGKFDAIIDFDMAVRDASTPPKLQASYDSGDGLHLNPTGYQKMANTVDLTLLAR